MARNILAELKEAQKQAAVLKNVRDSRAAKLAELEDAKSAAHIAEAEIPAMIEKKGDVQAALALGTGGSKAELDQIVKQIAQAQATVESHTQTVAGLKRSLDAAESDLEPVRYKAHMLVCELLREEANKVQADYIVTAGKLLSQFRQLQALGMLAAMDNRGDVFSMGGEYLHLSIPVFQLEASGQWPHGANSMWPKWMPCADITNNNREYVDGDVVAEKARLEGMGITL